MAERMRIFKTGATRDLADSKFDYEGFLSLEALDTYAAYMHHHRRQADGKLRDSDNWQKGIPRSAYMKSLLRHTFNAWRVHRGVQPIQGDEPIEQALCGVLFNTMGLLFEIRKGRDAGIVPAPSRGDQRSGRRSPARRARRRG
jgi:hypothetical protein